MCYFALHVHCGVSFVSVQFGNATTSVKWITFLDVNIVVLFSSLFFISCVLFTCHCCSLIFSLHPLLCFTYVLWFSNINFITFIQTITTLNPFPWNEQWTSKSKHSSSTCLLQCSSLIRGNIFFALIRIIWRIGKRMICGASNFKYVYVFTHYSHCMSYVENWIYFSTCINFISDCSWQFILLVQCSSVTFIFFYIWCFVRFKPHFHVYEWIFVFLFQLILLKC